MFDVIGELVVGAAGEAVAMTVVAIFADGVVVIEGLREGGARVERGLNVVDAAAVVVVGGVDEDTEFFAGQESLAERCRQSHRRLRPFSMGV